jgi:hypothetical protein
MPQHDIGIPGRKAYKGSQPPGKHLAGSQTTIFPAALRYLPVNSRGLRIKQGSQVDLLRSRAFHRVSAANTSGQKKEENEYSGPTIKQKFASVTATILTNYRLLKAKVMVVLTHRS